MVAQLAEKYYLIMLRRPTRSCIISGYHNIMHHAKLAEEAIKT